MDKFVVRRVSSFSSTQSQRQDEAMGARQAKRLKAHLDTDDKDSDSDLALVADSYNSISFEEPLASIESLDEAIERPEDGPNGQGVAAARYQNSIYVDAFNVALDTVLEQEEHLFSEKEKAVFEAWRRLGYEAQYLYVRLFLRKQATWHRTQRLSYQSDIGNLQSAVVTLQQQRKLSSCSDTLPKHTDLPDAAAAPRDWDFDSVFAFAEHFSYGPNGTATVQDAIALLSLDELKTMARQMKAVGKTKPELQSAILHMATSQRTILSAGLRRQSSSNAAPSDTQRPSESFQETALSRESNLVQKIMAIAGPCIRINLSVFKLFECVHLVFYRTSEWTEKSLTTIVLAKMSKRNFPTYVASRTANIFESRQQLLDFEDALRLQHRIDRILHFDAPSGGDGLQEVVLLFDTIAGRWRTLLSDEQRRHDAKLDVDIDGNDAGYLGRFKAVHVFTRIAHYAAHCFGRLHDYRQEYALLSELLGQRLFHLARRGSWYQRKALIEERYMAVADPNPMLTDESLQRKHWWRKALRTCETALQDRDCHLIYHYDLQKRILKLEKRLRIPRRLQHDFGHLRLLAPEDHYVEGVQVKREAGRELVERTVWLLDGLGPERDGGGLECSVEAMCLHDYQRRGWRGYHAEGGIIRTLFAYLFFDILFLPVPNVFQTAYQTCPLDLHTDAFFAARASEINRRLVDIANGEAPCIVRDVHAAHFARRTCVVGLRWDDFALDDIVELAQCFNGDALALVCKVLAQDYRQRGAGLPDLLLWRTEPKPQVLFAEVKSANDRLSDTQRMWIHVLAGAGVRVAVCHAVAKEIRVRGKRAGLPVPLSASRLWSIAPPPVAEWQ